MSGDFSKWENFFDRDQLKSVIFGLLRQNSFTFLESLEEASVNAVKSAMTDVALNFASAAKVNSPSRQQQNQQVPSETSTNTASTLTGIVGNFAKEASSHEWIDLFDVLAGSLLVLLHRIHIIHKVQLQ